MESRGRSRSWIYFLVFAVLVAGTYWARKLEVRARDSARSAATGLGFDLDTHVLNELGTIRGCLDEGICDEPNELGFPPGNAHISDSNDEAMWLSIVDSLSPEYHDYYVLTYEWGAVVRGATTPEGEVLDPSALAALLDGPLSEQMTGEIERAEAALVDRRDRGRLLSRLYGWTWKLTLVGFIGLPIAMSVIEERRQRRALDAMRRARREAEQPPATISAKRDVSA